MKDINEIIEKVEEWFLHRNLQILDGSGQLVKLQEEVDELKQAFWQYETVDLMNENATDALMEYRSDEVDAVGDILVVLIGYCMQRNLDIQECLELAYKEIKDRKGKVVDGIFVKEADLNE